MKNILITGATDGIGKIAAKRFANDGYTVYLHGRSESKVNKTVADIKSETDNDKVYGFVADLSDLSQVKSLTTQIKNEVSHIDVCINNAGVFNSSVDYNRDGLEIRFVVNYFAPYMLTYGVLPLIKQGVDPRIINLSSAAQSDIVYDTIQGHKAVNAASAYAQSKLAITMWSLFMSKTESDISVIAVNPGSLLNTKMANEAYGKYWSSANKGADIIYDLAICEKHKGITGKYFDNDSGIYTKAHPAAYNEAAINKLIEFTDKIIKQY
jgi:NAD(P)-dependent dehydrogenase (short-subunit alcohol dehydrogenase family)